MGFSNEKSNRRRLLFSSLGKNIAETLMNDQGRWDRMKSKFQDMRVKYRTLRQKILDRLSSTGLRILTRSKKMKSIPSKPSSIPYDTHDKQYDQKTNISYINQTIINNNSFIVSYDDDEDEYEYDEIDSTDENDEFEQLQNIRGICDQIAWNALDNNATVYVLTTYIVSDKTICSLSDVEPDNEYPHICEYGSSFKFNREKK